MIISIRIVLSIILGIFLMWDSSLSEGVPLSEVIGEVATSLIETPIEGTSGPPTTAEIARSWNNVILAEGKRTPADTTPTFQKWQDAKYDAVGYTFAISGQIIVTKQTLCVMIVSLPGQNTEGKTNEQLTEMLNALAQLYFWEFEHRRFVSKGEFDGSKVFSLSIDEGYKTGDWRDTIRGIINKDIVSFSLLKKKRDSALFVSGDPMFNIKWFDISKKTQ